MYEVITPPIDIDIKPIANLSESSQNLICSCESKCKYYVSIDDYGRFCEYDAKQIALSIISLVVLRSNRVVLKHKRREWTFKEDEYLIDWYKVRKGKAKYGDLRLLAELLERSYESVKWRIKYLRKKGEL